MVSSDPRERHLVAIIASHSRSGPGAPNAAEQEKVRIARLNLRAAKAHRKASEWLRIAFAAEDELANGGDDVAS